MDLNIKITLTDKMYAVIEDIMPTIARRIECAITKEIGKAFRETSKITVTATPTPENEEEITTDEITND